jgi:hypothetical protein
MSENNSAKKKEESWFPIARRDVQKIRNAHPGAKADRLCWLWMVLVSLSNQFNKQTFSYDLSRLAVKLGVSKRQTAKAALDYLGQLRMISMARPTRGQDGKYRPTTITVKPSVPCTTDRQSDKEHHVRNRNAMDRTVKHKEHPTDASMVIKKNGAAGGAVIGDSPGAHPDSAPPPSDGNYQNSLGHSEGAYVGGSCITSILKEMDTAAKPK